MRPTPEFSFKIVETSKSIYSSSVHKAHAANLSDATCSTYDLQPGPPPPTPDMTFAVEQLSIYPPPPPPDIRCQQKSRGGLKMQYFLIWLSQCTCVQHATDTEMTIHDCGLGEIRARSLFPAREFERRVSRVVETWPSVDRGGCRKCLIHPPAISILARRAS